MLKIGDFSRLGKVTVKTLRYYDEIGLLKPDFINEETGYRFYAPHKLSLVARIAALKEVGLMLEDIKSILAGDLTDEDRLELFSRRRRELDFAIRSDQQKLHHLDRMILKIGKEEFMESVILKDLPEVIVASMRLVINTYQDLFTVAPAMGKVMEKQGAVCRQPPYCFNIYHDGEYCERDIDLEICEAVVDFRTDGEGIIYKTIAEVPLAATILHRGPYETLGKSYAALFSWMKENHYVVADKPRESYIDGIWNKDDPAEWTTEIQIPVSA